MVRSYYPFVAILLVSDIGSVDCFKLPRDFDDTFERLRTPAGRKALSMRLKKPIPEIPWREFDRQIDAIRRHQVGVVTYLDHDFPQYLRDIPKSPPVLFYKGEIGALDRRGAAIVGSRRPSARGAAFTRTLSSELARRGILVTSGAATGIDTAAHRGALEAGGVTAAVVGTGLDVTYPGENKGLLADIAANGCVVSEQLMGTPALRHVFPLRNRLISGISHVVVVVEAGSRSGALITARWAIEQGRDVGAVPGFPGDARSRGTNRLLKMGAFPVEGVDDILEAVPKLAAGVAASPAQGLLWGRTAGDGTPERVSKPVADAAEDAGEQHAQPFVKRRRGLDVDGLDGQTRAVFDAVGTSPTDTDSVAAHCGLPAAVVQRALLALELEGFVARDLAGFYYRSCGDRDASRR